MGWDMVGDDDASTCVVYFLRIIMRWDRAGFNSGLVQFYSVYFYITNFNTTNITYT
jgi:hypothetical protein